MFRPVRMPTRDARRIWLRAQKLDQAAPFGDGPQATRAAVEHLGYVQIDTIHVVERCHHQILYTRIPAYRRDDLRRAQSVDKTVFEYWTHALSYVPTRDLRFYLGAMKRDWRRRTAWLGTAVGAADLRKVLARIRRNGALTIRDIDDDVLVEKEHAWASRKPSKRALQLAFFRGLVTVSERTGMLKTYELMSRHFGWERTPRPAPQSEVLSYLLERALRSQGIVSLDSACYLDPRRKPALRRLIEAKLRRNELIAVQVEGSGLEQWARPESLEVSSEPVAERIHILSPFDPLVLQRKRLQLFFGYEHRFEAYLPKAQRRFGYFAQPVLAGDEIVAAIDLKTDRERQKLVVQQWTWFGRNSRRHKARIEEALQGFERFQLAR
jgi:uncharacterized protein YcaQ